MVWRGARSLPPCRGLGEIVNMRLGILLLMAALPASQLAVPPPAAAAETGSAPPPGPSFQLVGRYETGLGIGSAEIVAFAHDRMYVTNSSDTSIDIVDLSESSTPVLVRRVDLSAYGASVTSVDARGRRLAAAVVADPPTDPGTVVVMDLDGNLRDPVTVGALPDSVAFTPNGRTLVVANEGEPDGYGPGSIDPEGTISLINTAGNRAANGPDVRRLPPRPVRTVGFRAFNEGQARHDELSPRVRVFGPGATVAEDLEPEGIAFSRDSRFAYITLQENNAIATIDIEAGSVVKSSRSASKSTIERGRDSTRAIATRASRSPSGRCTACTSLTASPVSGSPARPTWSRPTKVSTSAAGTSRPSRSARTADRRVWSSSEHARARPASPFSWSLTKSPERSPSGRQATRRKRRSALSLIHI